MQFVDLVEGQLVDVALDLADGEEVAGDVEHRAAVGVARRVVDGAARDLPGSGLPGGLLDGGGQELAQGLHAVEEPGGPARGDGDPGGRAVEPVALGAERALGQAELDAALAAGGDRQAVAGGGPQDAREVLADPPRLTRFADPDPGAAGDPVRLSGGRDLGGRGDHPAQRGGGGGRGGRCGADDGHARGGDEQQRTRRRVVLWRCLTRRLTSGPFL